MESIFKGNDSYDERLETLTVGDEICFSLETLELKRFGARITGIEQVRATVKTEGFSQHRQKKIYLLAPETGNILVLHEGTIMKYGAFKKKCNDESTQNEQIAS